MEQEGVNIPKTPTLQELVKSLGNRTNIVVEAQRLLKERGLEYATSTIYATIEKNGANNSVIEAAVLDAIAAEKKQREVLAARRKALSA